MYKNIMFSLLYYQYDNTLLSKLIENILESMKHICIFLATYTHTFLFRISLEERFSFD